MGLETKNDCAGEDQQQFTELDWTGQLVDTVCNTGRGTNPK
jgi:hypothetical protein